MAMKANCLTETRVHIFCRFMSSCCPFSWQMTHIVICP